MSSNNNNNQNVNPPPFGGNAMPDNICLSMDDGGEEVTRRIGGAPSFNPSFTSTTFAPSSVSSMNNALFNADPGASFDTTVRKGEVQTQSRSQTKFSWVLNDAPTLPEFHPLERSAVFVPNTSPSDVSARISDVLRERSIEASYNNEKALVNCVTVSGVDFKVFVYRGKNEYSHGIIVEVQRRFGTSISFYDDVKAILDAAEGKTPAKFSQSADSLPKAEEDNFKPNAASSLGMVSKMLSHSGYDSQYLAMLTLISLTDPAKVGIVTAKSIAEELLSRGNEVGHKVASMIFNGNQDNDDFGLRSMALAILANALSSVSLDVVCENLIAQLIPLLQQMLRDAENSPRQAHIAAMCIENLIGESNTGDDGLVDALELAAKVGYAKHTGLMNQAERCLQKITNGRH